MAPAGGGGPPWGIRRRDGVHARHRTDQRKGATAVPVLVVGRIVAGIGHDDVLVTDLYRGSAAGATVQLPGYSPREP